MAVTGELEERISRAGGLQAFLDKGLHAPLFGLDKALYIYRY